MNKISIIIPVYNTEEYLPRCIESVIKQTYKNIEIIVVNDSSLGNCKEIIREYQEKDNRIKLINNEVNKGSFTAREIGARASEGEYILYVDSDDWINLELCEKLSVELDQNVELITFNILSVTNTRIEKALWTNKGLCDYRNHTLFEALCDQKILSWAVWGKLFKKELAIDVYNKINCLENLTMAEDLLFFFYYAYFVETSLHIQCNGYYYDLTTSSVNRTVYTIDKAKLHLENLRIVILKIKNMQQFVSIDVVSKTQIILRNLAQSYFIRLEELSYADRKNILSLLMEIFGEEILVEYISDQAQFKDNKIRVLNDTLVQKIFPKDSRRYQIVRQLLLKIYLLINRGR